MYPDSRSGYPGVIVNKIVVPDGCAELGIIIITADIYGSSVMAVVFFKDIVGY